MQRPVTSADAILSQPTFVIICKQDAWIGAQVACRAKSLIAMYGSFPEIHAQSIALRRELQAKCDADGAKASAAS
jgi:hypothetical protein